MSPMLLGKFRGCLGLQRAYRLLEEEATLQVWADRQVSRPFGLFGGRPGAPSLNVLYRDGKVETLPAKFTMTMTRGDVLHHLQPGGGGFGDPLERDPARVLDDVRNEKVSVEAARRDYGMAVDTSTWTVDNAATAGVRGKVRTTAVEVPAD